MTEPALQPRGVRSRIKAPRLSSAAIGHSVCAPVPSPASRRARGVHGQAICLGGPRRRLGVGRNRVVVIDEDQGQSGQSMVTRLGFQRVLAEVSLDHVGLILGLEMSRLARSNKDWHQLLELCAIFRTLADADGLYDPTDYNDRLLLGLRGMMAKRNSTS